MISSALYFFVLGLLFTFLPHEINEVLRIDSVSKSVLISQTLGASLLAFGILNWMTRSNILGGIYGKPLMTANFVYFLVTTIAYLKSKEDGITWAMTAICGIFAVSFGYVTFTHPFDKK